MFLHYILNEDEESLVYRVLQAQLKKPVKGDWIVGVQEILIELEIELSLEDIKNLKEETLRKFAKEQINEKSLEYLNKQKAKHTKVKHIVPSELKIQEFLQPKYIVHSELKIQDFLQPNNVQSVHLSKFLFSARSRMLDFKINFRKKYSDLNCPLGCVEPDS